MLKIMARRTRIVVDQKNLNMRLLLLVRYYIMFLIYKLYNTHKYIMIQIPAHTLRQWLQSCKREREKKIVREKG